MKAEQFCYWLKGFFEISGQDTLTEEQTKMVKQHLDLVFNNITTKKDIPFDDLVLREKLRSKEQEDIKFCSRNE